MKTINQFTAYNSINSFLADMRQYDGYSWGSMGGDTYWYASQSYDEAEERAIAGDVELSKMVRAYDKLSVNIPSTCTRMRRMVAAIAGIAPHVPNYIAGVPTNMIRCKKEERIEKKIINVCYANNVRDDGTSVEDVAKVSARVLSCILSLERKGYRVNLYAANAARNNHVNGRPVAGFCVKLKDAGQHLDLAKVAMPLLSAAWNRRFGFRYREACGWTKSSNMGSTIHGSELRAYLDKNGFKYDVAFGFYDAQRLQTVEELENLFLNSKK